MGTKKRPEHVSFDRDGLTAAAAFRTQLRRFLHRTAAVTADAGLTPQRYDLLLMVKTSEGGRTTIGELRKALDLQQQAVTELVKRATEAGLIRRSKSPGDGRVVVVELTGDGERRLAKAYRALAQDRNELARSFRGLRAAFPDQHR